MAKYSHWMGISTSVELAKAVLRQRAQRGGAVDEHEVVGCKRGGQVLAKPVGLAAVVAGQGLHVAEAAAAGQEFQAGDSGGDQRLSQGRAGDQRVAVGRLAAQSAGGVALRIEVDQQGVRAGLGQRDGQIDGRGGLAHPPLLVGNTKNPTHGRPPCQP